MGVVDRNDHPEDTTMVYDGSTPRIEIEVSLSATAR